MQHYKTKEEAENRLYGTYFMYKNRVVHCIGVQGNKKITLSLEYTPRSLGDGNLNVAVDDPDLNFRVFNIGYANIEGVGAIYLMRMPQRHPQQGLTTRSFVFPRDNRTDPNYFLGTKPFSDMLTNTYPSVQEAYKMVMNKTARSVAYSKNWALERDDLDMLVIRYKGRRVANSQALDSLEFKLPEKFKQLKEMLSEQRDIRIA